MILGSGGNFSLGFSCSQSLEQFYKPYYCKKSFANIFIADFILLSIYLVFSESIFIFVKFLNSLSMFRLSS